MLICVATHALVPTSLLTFLVDILNIFTFRTQFIAIGPITGFEPVSPGTLPVASTICPYRSLCLRKESNLVITNNIANIDKNGW